MASAKEPRRSNRRSVHSSTSKSSGSPSPDAAPLPLHTKEPDANSSARSAASSSSNSTAARAKRAKDDNDEKIGAPSSGHRRTTSIASTANVHAAHPAPTPKRTKRRGKENIAKAEDVIEVISEGASNTEVLVAGEDVPEEDAGITRCVCEGLADDDGDAAEFMVQCELCMAWQHGPCMGFAQESELPPGDYYCEQCKPENHVELLKKLQRRQRQSSEKSLHNSHQSRNSRSHSPSYLLKTSKRRNTMNSRDAAYEESIQKLLDATAAEAGPGGDNTIKDRAESIAKTDDVFEDADFGPGARKKRKRAEDEITTAKRKRSSSILSERVVTVAAAADKPEATTPITSALLPPPPAPVNGKSRVRRAGGRKNAAAQDASVVGEGDEGAAAAKKHPNQYTYRGKSSVNTQNRRGPQSASGQNQQNPTTHDHGTRRNANNAGNLGGASGSGTRNAHNAYYNNMQLPMFTTWGLPDYLAHLQSILPSEVPPPLQIRGATSFFREDASTSSPGAGEAPSLSLQTSESADAQMANAMANATESLTERGVKVKWPAKRMSVADMNKRVRALVEWVGREQALALDRERRKAALENALAARQAHAPTDGVVASADRQRSPEPGANIAFAQTEGAAFIESPDHEKSASASAVNPDLGARAANGAPEQPVSASVSVSANANGSVDLRTLSALGFGFGFDESANAPHPVLDLLSVSREGD
ncbi:hypothetical protein EW145_g1173 [Phellinidium pouzarii]|uniref:Zinc finger PHD-type domain-containing protein n=1 Tax=Phellinidium pouzarii TaxID=167371 RepID=A0A4S4LHA6_9AGAM|nr:hypothetical protein EW145_g1173 [Phellinidium pouzarii]